MKKGYIDTKTQERRKQKENKANTDPDSDNSRLFAVTKKKKQKEGKTREVPPYRRRAANIHGSSFLFSGCTEEPQISCDEDVPRQTAFGICH